MIKFKTTLILLLIFTISPYINISFANEINKTTEVLDSNKNIALKTITGYNIFQGCRYYFTKRFNTKENLAKKSSCNGYFYGLGSTLLVLKQKGINIGICMPNDISTEQIIKDYLNWAKYNLRYIQVSFPTEAVITALKKKYPCKIN